MKSLKLFLMNKLHNVACTMNRKPRGLLCLSLVLASFIFQPTQALHGQEPIRLATRNDIPPYVMNNASTGIEIDLITAIFQEAKIPIEFVQMPRVRMIQMFDDGIIDGALTQNPNSSKSGCATNWYLTHHNLAFSLKSRNLTVTSFADLQKYSVLSFDGARQYLGPQFEQAVQNNKLYVEAADQSVHIELLYKKRFDVVIGEAWVLRLMQQKRVEETGLYHKLETHTIMPPTLYSARFKNAALCTAFNEALTTITLKGKYDQIISHYRQKIIQHQE